MRISTCSPMGSRPFPGPEDQRDSHSGTQSSRVVIGHILLAVKIQERIWSEFAANAIIGYLSAAEALSWRELDGAKLQGQSDSEQAPHLSASLRGWLVEVLLGSACGGVVLCEGCLLLYRDSWIHVQDREDLVERLGDPDWVPRPSWCQYTCFDIMSRVQDFSFQSLPARVNAQRSGSRALPPAISRV